MKMLKGKLLQENCSRSNLLFLQFFLFILNPFSIHLPNEDKLFSVNKSLAGTKNGRF